MIVAYGIASPENKIHLDFCTTREEAERFLHAEFPPGHLIYKPGSRIIRVEIHCFEIGAEGTD